MPVRQQLATDYSANVLLPSTPHRNQLDAVRATPHDWPPLETYECYMNMVHHSHHTSVRYSSVITTHHTHRIIISLLTSQYDDHIAAVHSPPTAQPVRSFAAPRAAWLPAAAPPCLPCPQPPYPPWPHQQRRRREVPPPSPPPRPPGRPPLPPAGRAGQDELQRRGEGGGAGEEVIRV